MAVAADYDFDAWMKDLETLCDKQLGRSTEDLPEVDYYLKFRNGLTPEQMLRELTAEFL